MDRNQLLQLIDSLPFSILTDVPGLTEWVEIPNLVGIQSKKVPNPYANLIGLSKMSEESIEETIDRVLEAYGNTPFGWFIGPLSTPANLRERLQAKGIANGIQMSGMVLEDLNIPIKINPEFDVVPVSIETAIENADVLAETYGMGISSDAVKVIVQGSVSSQIYFVYPKGSSTPVAWSNLVYIPGTHVVLLGGSATHPDWRGKNIYKSMVARRLQDARAAGANMAVIQAVKTTSAPICARLGFKEFCEFDFYFGNVAG